MPPEALPRGQRVDHGTAVLDKIEMEKFLREMEARLADPNVKWVDYDDIQWD